MTRAYYNEVDPYAVQWLRNLIAAKLITDGEVDHRSILDVRPGDLAGFTRCHFFAGIGVWDYALGLAGWPAGRPVWTGSCPCQPFSAAGGRGGFADERHLWPAFFHLIRECRPAKVLGEQVASKDGLGWLDLVQADLEGEGYAVGAADLCAAGVGAPHIRQRLWFVADASGERCDREPAQLRWTGSAGRHPVDNAEASWRSEAGILADAAGERQHGGKLAGASGAPAHGGAEATRRRPAGLREPARCGAARLLGDASAARLPAREREAVGGTRWGQEGRAAQQPSDAFGHNGGPSFGFWDDADWIACRDGKARPVEPGTFPLAHGAPARVGRLRAYGNAIVAEAASAFIGAVMEARP